MTATKEQLMMSMLLATLFQQEILLTEEDKKEFPLLERAMHTILDIWDTNRVKIHRLTLRMISDTSLLIQINDGEGSFFNSPLADAVHAEC